MREQGRREPLCIEVVVTDLPAPKRQDRDEHVVPRLQFWIRVDIDDLQRESAFFLQGRQGRDHVIAKMTVGAPVDDQMRAVGQLFGDPHRQKRGVFAAADLQRHIGAGLHLGQQLVELID